jgi:very-short-patch-repair endonuclease
MNLCVSSLERDWLTTVQSQGFTMPDRAQPLLSDFGTQPDFSYDKTKALIYVDGPHHHSNAMKQVDDQKRQALRDAGYKVIVFTEVTTDWPAVFKKFAFVFGNGASK